MNYLDCLNPKKCRARYGLEGLSQWCKHCRRKKKCTKFLEDGNTLSNQYPSSVSSSADNEDSMSDDILSRQINSIEDEHEDSNEENKQQFYLPSSTLTSQFPPNFRY